ncbi:hypothetical protein KEM54_002366 [Ascosphaera aggregata]|nr:hypothetical protein KEM54_002366 [Ascosphaera aggregata]
MMLEALNSGTVLRIVRNLNDRDLRTVSHTFATAKSKHLPIIQEELCRRATSKDIIEAKPLSLVNAAICNNLSAFTILARRSVVLRCRLNGDLTPLWERRDHQRHLRGPVRNVTTLLNVLCVLFVQSKATNHAGEMLKCALRNGATQDSEFEDTRYIIRTCIGFAASQGCLPLVRILVEEDQEYSKKHHYFRQTLASALAFAIRGGHLEIVKYLTQADKRTIPLLVHGSPTQFGCNNYLALAAAEADVRTFEFILKLKGRRQDISALEESLCRAAAAPCEPIVDDILALGIIPNTATIVHALYGDDPNIVQKVLRSAGKELAHDQHTVDILLRCSRSRLVALQILEHCPFIVSVPNALDAVYDVWDEYGEVRESQRHPAKEEVALLLIERGVLNARKKDFVSKGTLFAITMLGHTHVLQAVLSRQPHLAREVHDSIGNLVNAAVRGYGRIHCRANPEIVKLLAQHGVEIDNTIPNDASGRTPLMDVCASYTGDRQSMKQIGELVRSFIAVGANIYRRDRSGKSALEIAERVGNEAAAEALAEAWFDGGVDALKKVPKTTVRKRPDAAFSSCWKMGRLDPTLRVLVERDDDSYLSPTRDCVNVYNK